MNTRRIRSAFNLVFILAILASLAGIRPASAQTEPPGDGRPNPSGLSYGYDSETGRLDFVGGTAQTPLLDAAQTAGALSNLDAGAQVLAQYAPLFGVADPAQNLRLEKTDQHATGATLRYQQQYQGIPVLGGELLLNRDAGGNVLSLNGEVSPDLRLRSTRPAVSAARARATALAGMKSWYGLEAGQVQANQPALWIYDPAIFTPSDSSPVLVWRLDLAGSTSDGPVNELVLVNAATGRVALHFNQVNAGMAAQEEPPLDALYVSPDGYDEGNDCRSPLTPCQTIKTALERAAPGGSIYVQAGIYEEFFLISKDVSIFGGWDASFTQPGGQTILRLPPDYVPPSPSYPWGEDRIGIQVSREAVVNLHSIAIRDYTTGIELYSGKLNVFDGVFLNNAMAIYVHCSTLDRCPIKISNTTFSSNGTAFYSQKAEIHLNYVTIADHYQHWLSFPAQPDAVITVENSIVARNFINCSIGGALVSAGNNIFDRSGICDDLGILPPNFTPHSTDLYGVDPGLSPLIQNSYYALAAGSPAIDAAGPAENCPAVDLRGVTRPQGAACDFGAYEYTPPGAAVSVQAVAVDRGLTSSRSLDTYGKPRPPTFWRSIPSLPTQATLPGHAFLYPIETIALDASGAPVPDAEITFSTPEMGASAVFSSNSAHHFTTSTDATGIASAWLQANMEVGWFEASAQLGTAQSEVRFALGNGTATVFCDPVNGVDWVSDKGIRCNDPAKPCKTLDYAVQYSLRGELIFVAAGTYTSKIRYYERVRPNRMELFTITYLDRSVTISGGWDPTFTQQTGRTVLDAQNKDKAIVIVGGMHAVLDRMDITRSPVGVYNEHGNAEFYNSHIYNNTVGVENHAEMTFQHSPVFDNTVGIESHGALTVQESRIYGNDTGINSNSGQVDVRTAFFTQNKLGIRNAGTINLTNVTIAKNGCYQDKGVTCALPGGLLNTDNGTTTLTNVTIADNHSSLPKLEDYTEYISSGLHNASGTVRMVNTILANNQNHYADDCTGVITSLGHNLVYNGSYCAIEPVEGDFIGAWEHLVNPRMGYLEDLGDHFGTIPPLSGSPAIDGADPDACPQTDQLGVARPSGAGCDMGAWEGGLESPPLIKARTFTAYPYNTYPGLPLCDTPAEDCTGGTNADADLAHHFAVDVYRMFYDLYGREGVDGQGRPVFSTVNYEGVPNTFWTGRQIVYTKKNVVDDLAAHEFTHGVTYYTSHLLNYYQSGAIAESLSDLWGEYYDQSNGLGNDAPEVKWLIGEDLPKGAIRSMYDPHLYRQPNRMSSKLYWTSYNDNGGVHVNSGIHNKAIYLMVDGGTFYKITVAPIGWEKVLALYYYVQTRLLTSGAGFDDLYRAVNQACAVMTGGPEGITADDCLQARKALEAVEMHKSHKSNFNPDAQACPSGMYQAPTYLFHDDFESGADQWTSEALIGNPRWTIVPGETRLLYASSGKYALFGDDYDPSLNSANQLSDTYAAMRNGITVPSGVRTMLYFNHAYGFEYYLSRLGKLYFDGGVLEYTLNNGATWLDAKALYSAGQNMKYRVFYAKYPGHNPLRTRYAFVGESHGYVSSRYDLSKLAGKTVRFRWRLGTDYTGGFLGWVVDDVAIYTCVGKPATPSLASPSSGALLTSYEHARLDWKNATYAAIYDVQIAADSKFTTLLQEIDGLSQSEYTFPEPLTPDRRYYWRVRAINAVGMYGKWSSARYFRTGMTPPLLVAPENDATTTALRPTFQWSGPAAAKSYLLQVSKYASLSKPVFSTTVKTTSFTPSKNLTPATRYYWRVKANGTNPSGWSQVFTFTTP